MNIFEMYGIKEVANVTFYDAASGIPVLCLDTLKVSTIEETASNTSANGGWGNSPLIKWDYGKEITLTLEDALFSMKSLAFMQGAKITRKKGQTVKKSRKVVTTADTLANEIKLHSDMASPKAYSESGLLVSDSPAAAASEAKKPTEVKYVRGETYIFTWDQTVSEDLESIIVNADSFPGTYRVVGDTYARAYKGGQDEFFQFTIPMAKVNFENTITMQADGDPSTFNMNLTVLRPEDGNMITFTKYPKTGTAGDKDESIIVDFGK